MFRIRAVTASLAVVLVVAPFVGDAQPAAKIARIGFLSPGSSSDQRMRLGALRQGLRELGYLEGENIAIESRWADGKYDRLPGLAAELVRLKVDVIVTAAVPATRAVQEATRTIPIVMASVVDPVSIGLVASLARPGGNTTGLSNTSPELVGKQLEMLREVAPKVSLVAVLWNPGNPGSAPQLREAEVAARTLGMRLQLLEARNPADFGSAFAAMTRQRAGALLVLVDVMFVDQRTRIADLAARSLLPAVYGLPEHVEAGGLMAYGASRPDMFRRAATFVDKILKGAKPADLPVEQPTRFELIVNLRTAKGLGLTISPSFLARAAQVIQ